MTRITETAISYFETLLVLNIIFTYLCVKQHYSVKSIQLQNGTRNT